MADADSVPLSTSYIPLAHRSGQGDGFPPPGGFPTNASHPIHERVDPDAGSDTSSIGDELDVASITSSIEDHLTCRGRMQVVLHSVQFHIFIIILVILDALIVLFELLLDVGALENRFCEGEAVIEQAHYCHYIVNRTTCGPSADLIAERLNLTAGNGDDFCICGFRDGRTVCIPHDAWGGVNPAIILHAISITILSTFMVEVLLKLIAFRLKYFTHKFEAFDGFVVVISWALDVASLVREEAFEIAVALIIVLRLWRVVRIVNGAVLSAKARSDKQLHDARSHARSVIHALHKTQEKFKTQSKYREELQNLLRSNHISVPETPKPDIVSYPWDNEEQAKL